MTNDVVASVARLASAMRQLPGCIIGKAEGNDEIPIKHHFANGVYCREMFMLRDSLAVGEKHRYETNNILAAGQVAVVNPVQSNEIEIYTAPFVWTSPAGTQRAIYAMADSVWITTHPVPLEYTEADVNAIKAEVIVNDFEQLDRERA